MQFPISIARFLLVVSVSVGSVLANQAPVAESSAPEGLHWNRKRVRVELSTSFLRSPSSIKPGSDVLGAVTRSFDVWSDATGIEFSVEWSDRQSVSPAGRLGDGVNLITIAPTSENLLAIDADNDEVTARTRVFFARRGEISEADIALNPNQQFSTDGSFGTFDLQSTITHEIGHLLGLDHSPVISATMNALQARNGIFGVSAFTKQTLSQDDVSAVRAVYSSDPQASISGRILLPGGRPGANLTVWAEEQASGRVVAGRYTSVSGDYRLAGLERGTYRLFVQSSDQEASPYVAEELGNFDAPQFKDYRAERRVVSTRTPPTIDSIGFNGQFADLPILLNPGLAFSIYLRFSGQDGDKTRPLLYSRSGGFEEDLTITHFLGPTLFISSGKILIGEDSPEGDYSVEAELPGQNRRFFIGCLTLDRFSNPWSL